MTKASFRFYTFILLIFTCITTTKIQADFVNATWQTCKIIGGAAYAASGILYMWDDPPSFSKLKPMRPLISYTRCTLGATVIGCMVMASGIKNFPKLWKKIKSCCSRFSK